MDGRNFQTGEEHFVARNNQSVPGIHQKRSAQDLYRDDLKRLVYEKSLRQNVDAEKYQDREILRLEEQAQLEFQAKREMESRLVKRSIAQDHYSVAQEKRNKQAQERMMIIAEEQERIRREQQDFEYEKQAEAMSRAQKLKANQDYIRQQAEFNRMLKEHSKNEKVEQEKSSEEYINIMSTMRRSPNEERTIDSLLKRHQGLDSFNEDNAALKQQLEKDKRERAALEMRLDMQRQNEIKMREKERFREEMWREQEMSKQLQFQLEEIDELEKLKKQKEQEALQRAYNFQIQGKLLSENRNVMTRAMEKQADPVTYQSHNGQYDPDFDYRMMVKPPRVDSQRPPLNDNSSVTSGGSGVSRGRARGQFSPLIKAGTSIFS